MIPLVRKNVHDIRGGASPRDNRATPLSVPRTTYLRAAFKCSDNSSKARLFKSTAYCVPALCVARPHRRVTITAEYRYYTSGTEGEHWAHRQLLLVLELPPLTYAAPAGAGRVCSDRRRRWGPSPCCWRLRSFSSLVVAAAASGSRMGGGGSGVLAELLASHGELRPQRRSARHDPRAH